MNNSDCIKIIQKLLFIAGIASILILFSPVRKLIIVCAECVMRRGLNRPHWQVKLLHWEWYFLIIYAGISVFMFCYKYVQNNQVTEFGTIELYAMYGFSLFICGVLTLKVLHMVINVSSLSAVADIYSEVRDYASHYATQMFITGKNPYRESACQDCIVPFTYQYTLLIPLLTALLCKLTGISIITASNLLNAICVFGSTLALYSIVRDQFIRRLRPCVFLILFLYNTTFSSMWGILYFSHRPEPLSILILSCLFLCIYKRPDNVLISALLTVLLFFSKQYMAFVACPIFIYYMVQNGTGRAIKYFLYCAAISVVFFIFVTINFPLYWAHSIFSQAAAVHSNIYEALENILRFFCRYGSVLLIIFGGVIILFCSLIKKRRSAGDKYILLPLSVFVFSIICMLYFAGNGGDGYKYCNAMMGIPFLLLGVYLFRRVNNTYYSTQYVFILVLSVAVSFTLTRYRFQEYSLHDVIEIENLYENIENLNNRESLLFLCEPANSYLCTNRKKGKNIYFDNGHIIYYRHSLFMKGGLRNKIKHLSGLGKLYEASCSYMENVNNMVKEKKFSLICYTALGFIDKELLQENYQIYKSYKYKTVSGGVFDVLLYIPKREPQ